MQEFIIENACVAQNQKYYSCRYDEMVSRGEAIQTERDALQ